MTNNAALVFNRSNSLMVANDISGSGTLTQDGAGVLTLSGTNTYTGQTFINAGTLAISSAANIGNGVGTIHIDADAILSWTGATGTLSNPIDATTGAQINVNSGGDLTLSGTISGNFTKTGAGILTLTAAFSDTSTIQNGEFELTSNNTGAIVVSGAGAIVSVATSNQTLVNHFTFNQSGSLTFGGTGVQTTVLSGSVTVVSGQTAVLSAAADITVNLNGATSKDGGTLVFQGPGTFNANQPITGDDDDSDLVVDGSTTNLNAANTYNGPTIIRNAGTLNANVAGALPTPRSEVIMDATGGGNSTLSLGANQSIASLSGAATSTVNLGGNTLTVGTAPVTTTFAGAITGVGGNLVKDGASTLILTGSSNTYSGTTTVDAGTLIINGTLANSAITVNDGGTLMGSGTTDSITVNDGGSLSPGNANVGALSTGGSDLTVAGGVDLFFEYKNAVGSTPGTDWDLVDLGSAGIFNLGDATASNKINLYIDSWKLDNSGHGGGSVEGPNFNNFDPQTSYAWLFVKVADESKLAMVGDDDFSRRFSVIDYNNGSGVFETGNPFVRPTSSLGQGTFTVSWGSGSQGVGMYIHYSAVPEPGSMALCGLGALAAGWYGRRRLRNKKQDKPVAEISGT